MKKKSYWVEKIGYWWHHEKERWIKNPIGGCANHRWFKNKQKAFNHAKRLKGKVKITELTPTERKGWYHTTTWSEA